MKKNAPPVKERSLSSACQNRCLVETPLARWLHHRKFIDDRAAENLIIAIFGRSQ